ncbi:segregation and condensation protein A [Lentilactobacillus fungorum]|uniref:Segregation and condensation protein A n=1 Tax=Lentilactobacillus fungorum TaxID=2201250 RepID=A0ABQ3VWR2_9LACO|nr:segregation/condensation protein A [Lentilactobacillus fungorum]GHP12747.1 segregation and condensation protein A [Lentilactobacillus fungorum]
MLDNKQPELHLTDFDGPLEVLLHLIQESKMDIYDIQISQITAQYMQYIYDAQQLNLEIVGEYFVMAAKLMVIKSKMLLPSDEASNAEEPIEDPREALVTQLLNYQRYKLVAGQLKQLEKKRRQSFTRAELSMAPSKEELLRPSPFNALDLMASYVDALKRFGYNQPMSTTIHEWEFTIESQSELVRKLLHRSKTPVSFDRLIRRAHKAEEVVTDFLAILEMAKYREITLKQDQLDQSIQIGKGPAYDRE